MKKTIITEAAPTAIGIYSQATIANGFLFISGQLGIDPETNVMVGDDFVLQVQQVMRNLQAICLAAGTDLQAAVKLTVYLIDLNQFAVLNEQMAAVLHAPYPARAAIEVSRLPKDGLVEIDAIVTV